MTVLHRPLVTYIELVRIMKCLIFMSVCVYAGRTGRAGRPGKAITFYTEADIVNLRRSVGM